jgi:fluoride exporter
MAQIIAVGMGGFLGAISRFIIGQHLFNPLSKSYTSTLIINIFGCFLFGYFVNHSILENYNYPLKEFVLIGVLGGFTTFSTFGFEFISQIQKGQHQTAFTYVVLSITLGGFGIWLGINIYRFFHN